MRTGTKRSLVRAVAYALLWVAASFVAGCDESSRVPTVGRQGGPLGQSEVARVNGVAISIDAVAEVARALKVQPRVALDRLIGEQLLVEEAQRRGLDKAKAVETTARQAAVQTLLEREIETIAVSEDAITERYEAQRERFVKPERRKSLHILVSLGRDVSETRAAAGQALAAGILAELTAASDPKQVWERYRSVRELDGFTIKAEDVPAAARADGFAPEYLDGLFSIAAPGVVPTPIRTDFGWHVLLVTAIVPAETTPLEQARVTLRNELLQSVRAAGLEALVEKVTRAHRVERDAKAVDALLHADNEALGITVP